MSRIVALALIGGMLAMADATIEIKLQDWRGRSSAFRRLRVGCHFFKYVDEPVTGRPSDGENYNIGFTAVTDSVYPEMVAAAKAVHAEVYKCHPR